MPSAAERARLGNKRWVGTVQGAERPLRSVESLIGRVDLFPFRVLVNAVNHFTRTDSVISQRSRHAHRQSQPLRSTQQHSGWKSRVARALLSAPKLDLSFPALAICASGLVGILDFWLPQARPLGDDGLWADFVRIYILWRLTLWCLCWHRDARRALAGFQVDGRPLACCNRMNAMNYLRFVPR